MLNTKRLGIIRAEESTTQASTAEEMFSGIVKFIAGVVIGVLAFAVYQQTTPQPSSARLIVPPSTRNLEHSDQATARQIEALTQQLDLYTELTLELESSLLELRLRLESLEDDKQRLSIDWRDQEPEETETRPQDEASPAEARRETDNQPLTVASLVDAGIDQQQAAYLISRQGELEMQRLELRDRAIREGKLASREYANALRELNRTAPNLREEVGDDTYDRYLYATGRQNRVVVTSVIPGSPADQAGIRQGDMILGYGDSRVFTWSELRQATSEGYLGEYVTVRVQRGDESLSLLLPRGPLGVRLSTSSKPPLEQTGY
jgi:membrane-associated protease RseP (regulator of RpoE activity)